MQSTDSYIINFLQNVETRTTTEVRILLDIKKEKVADLKKTAESKKKNIAECLANDEEFLNRLQFLGLQKFDQCTQSVNDEIRHNFDESRIMVSHDLIISF